MLRTWLVRFDAMKFTLSVRSFQVPATFGTSAWPPSFPSVPTSRATPVTCSAKIASVSVISLIVSASYARHLVGERRQLVDHRVDGVGERGHLALRLDGDLLRQVAVRDRGGHVRDVADLVGQVRRHEVDVLGQVAPGTRDSRHLGLP